MITITRRPRVADVTSSRRRRLGEGPGLPACILGTLAIAVLSACSPDTRAQISAEHAVSARLKDPPSARFSNEFVVRQPRDKSGTQMLATCGVVDGKNGFGAYNGGVRFVVDQSDNSQYGTFDTFTVTMETDDNKQATIGTVNGSQPTSIFEMIYWNPSCVDAAHPGTHTGTTDYAHPDRR